METVAFWRRLHPLLRVGGTSPDAHAEGVARLEPLAQAVTDARAVLRAAKRAELAAFAEIRVLNLSVPLLLAGRFAKGHPVRSALGAVFALVPRSDALNLQRARRLIAVWRSANRAVAARKAGDGIVRDEVGLAEFIRMVGEYPQLGQATADAELEFHAARTILRTQHRKVDRLNKRAYLKFKAETCGNAPLRQALANAITREQPSAARRRK